MISGVYKITNTVNNRFYIGSSKNIESRIRAHKASLRRRDHRSKFLQRSYDKYGLEYFKFETVIICSEDNLLFYEQLLIDSLKPDFNNSKVAGSTRGYKATDETRALQSKVWKDRGMTDAQKQHIINMSSANKGKKKPPMTEEQKIKISESLKGRKMTLESSIKKSEATKGRKKTEEHKEKIRIAHLGKKREKFSDEWLKNMSIASSNRCHTDETKLKMSEIKKEWHKKRKQRNL